MVVHLKVRFHLNFLLQEDENEIGLIEYERISWFLLLGLVMRL